MGGWVVVTIAQLQSSLYIEFGPWYSKSLFLSDFVGCTAEKLFIALVLSTGRKVFPQLICAFASRLRAPGAPALPQRLRVQGAWCGRGRGVSDPRLWK